MDKDYSLRSMSGNGDVPGKTAVRGSLTCNYDGIGRLALVRLLNKMP
jgi:hypothetical protein